MRPAGAIRQALAACIPVACVPMPKLGAMTWRDAAQALQGQGLVNTQAPGEARLVKKTMENMVQAGQLQRVGSVTVPGSRRQMAAYARPGPWVANTASLDGVFRAWIR
nr:hypothetical protein [uncultured Roseateles sp.]